MLAPLLDANRPATEPNWYQRVSIRASICATRVMSRPCAFACAAGQGLQASVWSNAAFVSGYGQ